MNEFIERLIDGVRQALFPAAQPQPVPVRVDPQHRPQDKRPE